MDARKKDLINRVCMMGFDLDVAEFAAVKVNYQSVEAAIEYLVGRNDTDGKFVHEFVEAKEAKCYLCKEPASEHRAFAILPGIATS